MHELFENQKILFEQRKHMQFFNRDRFEEIQFDNHTTGIVGPRGIGKTTFLLHRAMAMAEQKQPSLYVSADSVYFLENNLIDLVDRLYKETSIRHLFIDEIHKYPNWNQTLKHISDSYLRFKIVFTGSSTIDLIKSRYDLSRRVTLHHLVGFSFREFLHFRHDIKLPIFKLETLLQGATATQAIEVPGLLKLFNDYLDEGYYPFLKFLHQPYSKKEAVLNTIQKIIYEDIGSCASLKTPTLRVIEKLYQFVLHSQPGELNASKLATALNKDFDSVREYLNLLPFPMF